MSGPPDIPVGVRAMHAELATRVFADLDDAQAFLERRMAEYNATPQAELGGLSPVEMADLLGGDWDATGPLRLHSGVGAPDFAAAPFVLAARRLLTLAAEAGGIPATASAGNLTRKTVADLMDAAPWPATLVADVRAVSKVINERDFAPVHVLRIVLDLGGLMRRRKKAFRTLKTGRALLPEDRLGELAARLFRAFFRAFNLAYLGGWDDTEPLQPLVPYFLLRLRALDDAWRTRHELVPLLHPELSLGAEVERERARWAGYGGHPEDPYFRRTVLTKVFGDIDRRVLRPLGWFGLLETRERASGELIMPWRDFRKTGLFDRFVRFPPEWIAAPRRGLG